MSVGPIQSVWAIRARLTPVCIRPRPTHLDLLEPGDLCVQQFVHAGHGDAVVAGALEQPAQQLMVETYGGSQRVTETHGGSQRQTAGHSGSQRVTEAYSGSQEHTAGHTQPTDTVTEPPNGPGTAYGT